MAMAYASRTGEHSKNIDLSVLMFVGSLEYCLMKVNSS